ncbi:hypothetical protein CPB84DRAFT_1082562 [Gymnopilus junonius]|uniref:Transcription factor TFIIB cyclin-like domain-containing protein n=1 Tax=Gymnopilus junonius TaxID=109634 RepID=A0A9P5TSS1_GYMJU|nr:hypothetical protein CPB84DRAFT_1082562 [Gymnopilus junonius]
MIGVREMKKRGRAWLYSKNRVAFTDACWPRARLLSSLMSCTHCGASTVWDDTVGSAVCTLCASLADPSQSVLTAGYSDNLLWDSSPATTLKSLRARNNWDLAGQGKESRDRKNAYAIAEFIKSLAVSLNASGLSPRAVTLFNQIRAADSFRWGEKSKRVAAACLSIALRESNRPDSLRDIASLLSVPTASVIREFTHINSTLSLSLSVVDPSVYISTLQNHIASALNENQQDTGFPDALTKSLRALSLLSVANTATSLSEALVRLSPEHDVLRLPVPPTACALFILAIEAENRTVLNPLVAMAQFLGSRCHVSKSVVMARYKTIQDEIATWIEKVPWLTKYESKQGRAKVAKRLIVARGIKDVIQFQEDIWKQKPKPSVELELYDDETNNEDILSNLSSRPTKRRKLNHAMTQAMQFLVDPLSTKLESVDKKNASTVPSHLHLATYILTNSSNHRPPTRLQLLALDRGGVTETQIPDDDLFAEGEFEKLLRSEEEIQVLRQTFGWTESEQEEDLVEAENKAKKKPRKRAALVTRDDIIHGTALSPSRKSRLNMEALAQFMAGDNNEDSEEGDFAATMIGLEDVFNHYDDENGDTTTIVTEMTPTRRCSRPSAANSNTTQGAGGDEEVVIENWRPSTPERIASDSRYEEEHPP